MTEFLTSVPLWRRLLVKQWLRDSMSKEAFQELFAKYACPLLELVCCLFGKRDLTVIGDFEEKGQLILSFPVATSDTPLGMEFGMEYINRLLEKYERAVSAIQGDILKAKEAIVHGNTRYWVRPKQFFEWAHKQKIAMDPDIEKWSKECLEMTKVGRAADVEDAKTLERLVEASQDERHLSAERLCEVPKVQSILDHTYRHLSVKKKKGKIERLIKKLRDEPGFCGKRSQKKSKTNAIS